MLDLLCQITNTTPDQWEEVVTAEKESGGYYYFNFVLEEMYFIKKEGTELTVKNI